MLRSSAMELSRSERRILLFELGLGGHRPGYIQHLIRYWNQQNLAGTLHILVRPEFIQRYPDVVVAPEQSESVKFVAITDAEEFATYLPANAKTLDFREWRLLAAYAEKLRATHCLIMYFDFMKLPAAVNRALPCSFSGIYFRPTFHYESFEAYHPTWRDRLQACRERAILSWILRHPKLKTLFSLDPFAVEALTQFHTDTQVVPLPDPVQRYDDLAIDNRSLKSSLGIEPQRQVFLLFGELNQRKGLHQLLDAIPLLSHSNAERLCLLLVGPISPDSKPFVEAALAQPSPAQIITVSKFITDVEIQPYFQMADVILAPYQQHVGMSAILVRAAAAGKPVLSSNYGLMGELTHRYKLGLAVDSTQASAIAQGLGQFLQRSPQEFCDRQQMQRWAEENTAEKFAQTIFRQL